MALRSFYPSGRQSTSSSSSSLPVAPAVAQLYPLPVAVGVRYARVSRLNGQKYKRRENDTSSSSLSMATIITPTPLLSEQSSRLANTIAKQLIDSNMLNVHPSDRLLCFPTESYFLSSLYALPIENSNHTKRGFMITSMPNEQVSHRQQQSHASSKKWSSGAAAGGGGGGGGGGASTSRTQQAGKHQVRKSLYIILDISGSMDHNAIDTKILFKFFTSSALEGYDDILIFPWNNNSYPVQYVRYRDGRVSILDPLIFTNEERFREIFINGSTSEIALKDALFECFTHIRTTFFTDHTQGHSSPPTHAHYIIPLTDGIFDTRLDKAGIYNLTNEIKLLREEGISKGHLFASALLGINTFDKQFLRLAKILDSLFFGVENPIDHTIASFDLSRLPPLQMIKISAQDKGGRPIVVSTSNTIQPSVDGSSDIYVLLAEYQGLPIFLETDDPLDSCTLLINDIPMENHELFIHKQQGSQLPQLQSTTASIKTRLDDISRGWGSRNDQYITYVQHHVRAKNLINARILQQVVTTRDPEKKKEKIRLLLQYYQALKKKQQLSSSEDSELLLYNNIWYICQMLCRRYSYDGTAHMLVSDFRDDIIKLLRQEKQANIEISQQYRGPFLQQLMTKAGTVETINSYLAEFLNAIISHMKAMILQGIIKTIKADITNIQVKYAVQWLKEYFGSDDSQIYVPLNLLLKKQAAGAYQATQQQKLQYIAPAPASASVVRFADDPSSLIGTGSRGTISHSGVRATYKRRNRGTAGAAGGGGGGGGGI